MIKRLEIGIGGRALGRDSTDWVEKMAGKFGITGAVFTRPDGSIRVTAEGEEKNLREFAWKIESGHIFGTVENFYTKWSEPSQKNFYVLVGC